MDRPGPRRRAGAVLAIPAIVALFAATVAACGTDGGPDEARAVALPVPQIRDAGVPWQPEPIRLTDDQLAAALHACQANQMIPPGGQVVLVDARGQGRVTVLFTAPGPTSGDCTVVQDSLGFSPRSGSAMTGEQPNQVGPNDVDSGGVSVEGGETMNSLSAPSSSSLSGRVGQNVVAVQLVVAGRPILASVGNGWFAAWWPSRDPITRTIAFGSDGSVLPTTAP